MLPVKRCPLFACSGHFRVIVTHSDTLKEMDCSGPGGPRGDHPLRHSRGHYLAAPSKGRLFKRCRQNRCVGGKCCVCCNGVFSLFFVLFFSSFHRINPRLGEGGYFGRHRLKSLGSGVIVGCGDARCCYGQRRADRRHGAPCSLFQEVDRLEGGPLLAVPRAKLLLTRIFDNSTHITAKSK